MSATGAVVNRLPEESYNLSALNQENCFYAEGYDSVSFQNSEFWPEDPSIKQVKFSGFGAHHPIISISSLDLKQEDDGDPFEFVFAAKMQGGGQITVTLTDVYSSNSVTTDFPVQVQPESPNGDAMNDLSWGIYRSKHVIVNKGNLPSPRLGISVSIDPDDPADEIVFAIPTVSGLLDQAYYSEVARNAFAIMPSVFVTPSEEENPVGSVTRYIDVAFHGLDLAAKSYRDYRFFTSTEGRDETKTTTLSELVWAGNAGLSEAKWLAQFAGTEPVSKLSSSIDPSDPFVLGSPENAEDYGDPGSGGSELNGSDSLRYSTTGINDPPLATTEVTRDFLRWQAEYGYYGLQAGSYAAVVESVKRVMVDPKEVTVTKQHDGPFTVLIQTPWEQTYGANEEDVGNQSSVVVEAIRRAKPIGVKITHQLT